MKGPKKQRQESEISVSGVDLGQLERLLSFMSQHGLEEFEYAHGDLRIRAADDLRLSGEHTLTVRATASQPGDLRVVSEATVLFITAK